MIYKEKLNDFNKTSKYHVELSFLYALIDKRAFKILDYGCGTGYAVNYFRNLSLNVYGYDATMYNKDFEYSPAVGSWDTVYFMHSIAHIDGIKSVLKALNCKTIIVITPNKAWLDMQENKNYIPDPTVKKHYYLEELVSLFEECGFKIAEKGHFGKECGPHLERLFLKARKI